MRIFVKCSQYKILVLAHRPTSHQQKCQFGNGISMEIGSEWKFIKFIWFDTHNPTHFVYLFNQRYKSSGWIFVKICMSSCLNYIYKINTVETYVHEIYNDANRNSLSLNLFIFMICFSLANFYQTMEFIKEKLKISIRSKSFLKSCQIALQIVFPRVLLF